jgi:ribosomal-protein-serine acetyltransferase
MLELRSISESDADALFPLIFRSNVTDTLVWDGPESIEALKTMLRDREEKTRAGMLHAFAILNNGLPIGTIRIGPNKIHASGDIGLWIGSQFQGHGYGTESVRLISAFGFEQLNLHRLEARVFVGNMASRRVFEKNGFSLEGILRQAALKRATFLDEWIFGKINQDSKCGA